MKGGCQILDLRDVSLELSSETQNFTNANILKQLRALRDYIEKAHDYKKPLNEALKTILIRYRDGKNNELLEACGFATIYSSNASLTYEIKCKDLMIEVVFEEKTDDYDNKYYDIKTAKYLYNKNEIVEGDLDVSGDAKLFENIVDTQGHKRFIEGDITINEISGITQTYGKWSLSGSHLLIVVCITIANGSSISGQNLVTFGIPQWVYDKVKPLASGIVESKSAQLFANDYSSQNVTSNLLRGTSPNLLIQIGGIVTTAERNGRIAFDLLIDNETQN